MLAAQPAMEPNSLETALQPPPTSTPRRARWRTELRPPAPANAASSRTPIWQLTLAGVLALAMIASTACIMVTAVGGRSPIVPSQPSIAGWLSGITDARLGYHVFLTSLIVFTVGYAGLVTLSRRLSTRAVVALIAVLYVIVFVGPIVVSTDVFSYIAYARMGVLHGLNPYVSSPFAIRHDPSYRYVGTDWLFVPTAYGPLYTLISYPFALLGMTGAVWGMKTTALLACVVVDWLTWRCARLRELDSRLALLIVAANPLVVIYSLASAQNDLVMIALVVLGVYLALTSELGRRRRSRLRSGAGAAGVALGALIKAPAVAVLPYMLVGRRRISAVAGAAVALGLGLVSAYAAFGSHGIDLASGVNRDSAYVSVDSFANEIAHLLGKPGIYPADHHILDALLVVFALYLLWRTWRGYEWIAAAGWVLLATSVTSTWLQAWYLVWPLPLAVISRDRRLLWATLFVEGLFVIHQLPPMFDVQ